MRPTTSESRSEQPSVLRFESFDQPGAVYPSLHAALARLPSREETQLRTSRLGVLLAEAEPVNGAGTILIWCLTLAGHDLLERSAVSFDEMAVAS